MRTRDLARLVAMGMLVPSCMGHLENELIADAPEPASIGPTTVVPVELDPPPRGTVTLGTPTIEANGATEPVRSEGPVLRASPQWSIGRSRARVRAREPIEPEVPAAFAPRPCAGDCTP